MSDRLILLDLGGVLIEVVSAQRLAVLMDPPVTAEEAAKRWSHSKYLALFESGRCSRDEFAEGVVRELHLSIPPDAFMDEFDLFLRGFYPGAEALLQKLARSRHTLACLTDTNCSQWASLCKRLSIDQYFQHCLLSYQIGRQKPDAKVYQSVIRSLSCSPEKIVYFDDREANVQAGLRAGMESYRVDGVCSLEQKLMDLNLL